MKTRIMLYLFLAVSFVIVGGCSQPKTEQACQQCVDFELPLTVGTKFGSTAGQQSGDVIFKTNGIIVSVLKFITAAGTKTFGNMTIGNPPIQFSKGQAANTNTNLGFDFSNIGFTPIEVQFEFLDWGAIQNISVNGSNPYIGKLSAAPSSIGGVSVAVYTAPVSGKSASKGVVILRGPVKNLMVGGQEFWLDQVCARR